MNQPPTLAVSIATHNRRSELAFTLERLAELDPLPDAVWVCADGCSDDTVAFVREKYPEIHLLIHETARGSIATRDRIMREAQADIVLCLDDDSHPIETDFIARVKELFAAMPRLAVASFPQRSDEFPETLSQKEFGPSLLVGTYVNCSSAFNRDAYAEVGPFDFSFGHAYDESDYSLRCLERGWQVYHYTGITIRHRYSPQERSEIRIHHQHARNEQWSIWKRCPLPYAIPLALFRVIRQFLYACRRGPRWVVREPLWWGRAVAGFGRASRERHPISWAVYSRWLRLLRRPEIMSHELEA